MRIGVGTSDNTIDRANSHDSVYGSTDTIVQTLLSYGVKIDFMPEIASDGKELVDWIAEQSWSDGNVGMFGGSYLGYTQLVIAGEKPEALKAIFPEVVAMDGYSTKMRPGGVFCQLYSSTDTQTLYEMNNYIPSDYVYPTSPVIDVDGDGDLWDEIPLDLDGDGDFLDDYNYPEDPNDEPQYADGNKRKHIYYLATYEHKNNVPYNTLGQRAEKIGTDVELGSGERSLTISAYEASPAAAVPDIMASDIAIYNHGSWMDTFITGTTELYNTMKDTNASKMVIDPGYHETYSPYWKYCGEDEAASMDAYAVELVRFYDRYLKGIENGIDTEEPVFLYNMNSDGWRFEEAFPLERQVETDYYFGDNGTLTADAAAPGGTDEYAVDLTQDSSYYSSEYSYGVSRYVMAAPDEVPDRTQQDEKCLTYTAGALSEDTEVTGYPIVSLYVSSTSANADFHVYLEDVDENGKAILVTEGLLNAGFDKTYDNDTMILGGGTGIDVLRDLPWHGFETAQYDADVFADGNVVELKFELFPTSWTFKAGHSIRISIACADSPTFETNSALTEGTIVTVYRTEEYSSKIG